MKNFIFPVADRRLRTSTLIRERFDRGEEQKILRGESDGLFSPSPHQDDSTQDDAEAKMTSGLLQEVTFIAITWDLESNCTRRKKNHFLLRRSTSTLPEPHTSLDVLEKHFDLERRWRSWFVRYLDRIYKIHNIERETVRRVFVVRRETDKKTNDFKTRKVVAGTVETHVRCIQTWGKAKMDHRKTETRSRQKLTW